MSSGRLWFQLYMWKDRGLVAEMVQRAADSGYEALCLTVDTAVFGKRERDVRRGFTLPPKIGHLHDPGRDHPSRLDMEVRHLDPIVFANVAGRSSAKVGKRVSLAEYFSNQHDPSLSWGDIEWLQARWDGPIVIKGIQTVEDAVIAAEEGVEAIAVSNHGGRQLDSSPATLELLPQVVDAVGDRLEIICDGGVRRGSDIVKAVALGASACMAGRAYLYGLGAAGEPGVDHVLDLFASDMRRTMALIGCRTVKELDREYVDWS